MTAVVILPQTPGAVYLANLVDGPFLRHVVEFVAAQGIRDILIVGAETAQAKAILGLGHRWDVSIAYHEAHDPSDYAVAQIADDKMLLLVDATVLPKFSVPQPTTRGAVVFGAGRPRWTGWAIVEPRDIPLMPPLCNRAAILCYLESLEYPKLYVDSELRCGKPEEIWRAHEDVLQSNLGGIFHGGLEVRPGVWLGRNAAVASSANIVPPVYIGDNSRVGADAQIGPFAAIGKDCLIAPKTIVRHSVIAPGTYAGNNLELDHVVVDQRKLFDVRFNVSLEHVGSGIIDDVFDLHWTAILRRLRGTVESFFARFRVRPSSTGSPDARPRPPAREDLIHRTDIEIPPANRKAHPRQTV
jgi:hypothetical protein